MRNIYIISLFYLLFSCSGILASGGHFIENRGQWNAEALFKANTPAYDIWIGNGKIKLDSHEFLPENEDSGFPDKIYRKGNILEFDFSDADFSDFIAIEKKDISLNYFKGEGSDWKKNINPSEELIFKNVYPATDLRLYFEGHFLRFDFILHPGADPSNISIKINGTDNIRMQNGKELHIGIPNGNIVLKDIFVYQIEADTNKEIPFDLSFAGKELNFRVADHDRSKTLVIDPLIFSTFLGGDNYDYGEDVKVDSAGNVYTCGYSYSSNYPTTAAAYNDEMTGEPEAFPDIVISKFNPDADSLIFSTFIGGVIDDYGKSIALDQNNNVFITGYCGPTSTFPTTSGVYDSTFNGGYDVFVIKLSSKGDSLLYSTFIGGTQDDYGQSIAIDDNGNAYVTGYTSYEGGFPVTDNAYDRLLAGEYDVFISKLGPGGKNLIYSTYLGGKHDDFGQDIAVDEDGKAYITGITRSSDYPVSSRAYDRTYNDTTLSKDRGDCFLSKINEIGTQLEYSSFFGGRHTDGAYGIAIDSLKNMYFAGISKSSDYPVTENAYQMAYYGNQAEAKGHGDIIVTKVSPLGDSLIYSTYIGGESTDRAFDMVLDRAYNVLMTGSTASEEFPTTKNAYDRTWNDSLTASDVFLVKLSADGSDLFYSTYIGGRFKDVGNGLDYLNGLVYITGITASSNFPITHTAFDTLYNGDNKYDIFVTKLYPFGMNFGDDFDRNVSLCFGDSVQIGDVVDGYGTIEYRWSPDESINNVNIARPVVFPKTTTTYTIIARDENGISAVDSVTVNVRPVPSATIRGPEYVMINSRHVYIADQHENTAYSWSSTGGIIESGIGTNELTVQWLGEGDHEVRLHTLSNHGCEDWDTLKVKVGDYFKPNIIVWGETEICEGDTVILDAGAGYSAYLWNDSTRTRYDSVTTSGDYWVVVADEKGFIGLSDTITVTVYPLPEKPEIVYLNEMLRCYSFYAFYQWYKDGEPIIGAVSRGYVPTEPGIYYLVVTDGNGCSNVSNTIDLNEISVEGALRNDKIRIIPNPNNGIFKIVLPEKLHSFLNIEIIDIFGQVVFAKKNFSGENLFVQQAGLVPGVYMIRLVTADKIYFAGFVRY